MSLQVLSLQWFGISSELQTEHHELTKTANVHLKLLQAKLLCNILDGNGWNMLERVSQQNACEFIACILIILYNFTINI
jgi:hypothetical protein